MIFKKGVSVQDEKIAFCGQPFSTVFLVLYMRLECNVVKGVHKELCGKMSH